MVKDYRLDNDERMMFDWLVVKQEDFGLDKPFRHSIPQVQKAIHVSRRKQEKAIRHFESLGFLTIGIDYYQNNPFRTYYVNFQALSKFEVISEIINPETETFNEFVGWVEELAISQALKQKPPSRYKQKQKAEAEEKAKKEANLLYKRLCETWNQRIDMFNKGELSDGIIPERKKRHIQLPINKNGLNLLYKLNTFYERDTIRHAFIAYTDKCLKGEIHPKKIFLYFLTCEDGDFKVVEEMVNVFAMDYSYT